MVDGWLPGKTLVGDEGSAAPAARASVGGLAEGQGGRLGEAVGEQLRVMSGEGKVGLAQGDEVAGDEAPAPGGSAGKRVLAVGAGFAPDDGAGGGASRWLAGPVDLFAVAFHFELLQMGRLLGGPGLAVGQNGVAGGAGGRRCSRGQQGEDEGRLSPAGAHEEMVVHVPGAGEKLRKMPEADGQGEGRPIADHRRSGRHPVPEFEDVFPGDAEGAGGGMVGRYGDEVPGHAPVSPAAASSQLRAVPALAMVSRVVKVLLATMNRVVRGLRPARVVARSAPSTLATKWTARSGCWPGGQRPDRHARAEVGAADADIDDVGDALAGETAPPGAAVDGFAKASRRARTAPTSGGGGSGPQRHMADGPASVWLMVSPAASLAFQPSRSAAAAGRRAAPGSGR